MDCFVKICCFCCLDTFGPTVIYGGRIGTRIYNATEIRQVSQVYESSSANPLCWCCCLEYNCAIEVCFQEFAHNGLAYGVCGTTPSNSFLSYIGKKIRAVIAFVEVRFGIGSDKLLYVYSKTEDMVHNGNL